jgi:hypothetical protein
MCCCHESKQSCQKPENLKGKPADCTPRQIRQCHGQDKKHPCTRKPPKRAAPKA